MRQKMLFSLAVVSLPFLVTSCLSDDADAYFGYNEGNVPMLERQTMEAYLKETAVS